MRKGGGTQRGRLIVTNMESMDKEELGRIEKQLDDMNVKGIDFDEYDDR